MSLVVDVCRPLDAGLLRGDDGRVARKHEMAPRVRHKVRLEVRDDDIRPPSKRSEAVSEETTCEMSQAGI